MSKPLILVSNDDGVHAPGLQALVSALNPLGEVWVVAPDRERSAASHAISLHVPLRIEQLGDRQYSVDGTPTDCVYLALHHLLPREPTVVVSGINRGANLSNDVLYSGTVSAAMEGALYGHRAVAVSLCLPDKLESGTEPPQFGAAARIAATLTAAIAQQPAQPGVVLNVNIPNGITGDTMPPVKLTRLGYTDWASSVHHRTDPRGKPYYWIGGERNGADDIADSDNQAIAQGHVSVTPIHYDLTDYRSFDFVRSLTLDGIERSADQLGNTALPHPVHPMAKRS